MFEMCGGKSIVDVEESVTCNKVQLPSLLQQQINSIPIMRAIFVPEKDSQKKEKLVEKPNT